MSSTRIIHRINAPRARGYRVLLDARAIAKWKVPDGMTCHVHAFDQLVPNEQMVEVDEFETNDPAMRGKMTVTITLADADGGTDLLSLHDGLPPGVSPADNETGWRMALTKLAALVEAL
ncbi:MAG: SRPBCC domain-containing protein [Terrimicrobiaceae bacterium]